MALNSGASTAPPDLAISPGQGRRARQVTDWFGWLFPPVYLVVTALLVQAGLVSDALVFGNLVTPLVSVLVVFYSATGWHVTPYEKDLLSVRTLTGRRTVDLARLTKVGRSEVASQASTDDRLILTDAHGVRVIVNGLRGGAGDVDRLVRRALLERPIDAGVVVSARAGERLGLEDEVRRANQKMVPGRSLRGWVIGWMPLLLCLVYLPLGFGFLILGYLAAGSP
ncbi:hypothetical protein H9Y04_20205 [Streptomyces sp. TRM66268-LWL]|uniref:PH domain-containing protein n=1 Tax=Streptomyces polyasparticus TaxID=2767826 RepID=A0ABR7SHA5_9ACTN|nr:hypothetical protein [Streptomyces polyasparticus]MBC9714877.1 hypothetical protein [Streptomyces polyasparticus]